MLLAILTEVMGTLAMKYSLASDERLLGMTVMYVMLIFSYSSLAIAVKKIPLALAYGIWESLGLILIVGFSYYLFAESLGTIKLIAVGLIVIGIILIEMGIMPSKRSKHVEKF